MGALNWSPIMLEDAVSRTDVRLVAVVFPVWLPRISYRDAWKTKTLFFINERLKRAEFQMKDKFKYLLFLYNENCFYSSEPDDMQASTNISAFMHTLSTEIYV